MSGQPPTSASAPASAGAPKGDYLFSFNRDVKALNAAVLVITQKIKHLVRNEKILGRNLIVLNKRIREMQLQNASGVGKELPESVKGSLDELSRQVGAISQRLIELEAKVEDVSKSAAKNEDVKEMKFVVDAFNPLHFVTMDQAKELMGKEKKN